CWHPTSMAWSRRSRTSCGSTGPAVRRRPGPGSVRPAWPKSTSGSMTQGRDDGPLRGNRAYRRLWLSQCLATLGDIMYDVAVVWYLVSSSGRVLTSSGVAIGAIAGRLVGAAVAGAALDAWSPRTVMIRADLVRGLLTGSVAIVWLLGAAPSPALL